MIKLPKFWLNIGCISQVSCAVLHFSGLHQKTINCCIGVTDNPKIRPDPRYLYFIFEEKKRNKKKKNDKVKWQCSAKIKNFMKWK